MSCCPVRYLSSNITLENHISTISSSKPLKIANEDVLYLLSGGIPLKCLVIECYNSSVQKLNSTLCQKDTIKGTIKII